MSRRHELDNHRCKLSEIRNIMSSMKTLAYMETLKLERFIKAQSAMTKTIDNMAADFLYFNPQVLPVVEPASHVVLLVGSERGFCGDFNEQLIKQLKQSFDDKTLDNTILVGVGGKLHPLLSEDNDNIINLKGADVIEEILSVVSSLAETLTANHNPASLSVLHHNNQHNELITEKLLPPFNKIQYEQVNFTHPPLLNSTPKDFLIELTEYYLFNSLHRILYVSLMIENQHRIQHLENATHHLDEKTDELKRKVNALRQEEIIEEIEVMLLNTSKG